MKKALVVLMAIAMVFAFAGIALAKGNIGPKNYDTNGLWAEKEQGKYTGRTYTGYAESTHVYGTWNSPYTAGVDGYNYNDAQDYTDDGDLADKDGDGIADLFKSGPHGGYLTSTHRCRECHAVHRAAGKFKLLRSDTRYEACDWCHGTGAGSGFNIQMDNDDNYSTEYNVGHTMGFGIENGKWKAPDDTYPAFTPNYWQGGFSCFDCHSPHANPQRMLGFNDNGTPVGLWEGIDGNGDGVVDLNNPADTVQDIDGDGKAKVYSIVNSGHDLLASGGKNYLPGTLDPEGANKARPWFIAGSWLIIKNPDREIARKTESVTYFDIDKQATTGATVTAGQEISDMIYAYSEFADGGSEVTAGLLTQFDDGTGYPVNKMPTDWNTPVGLAKWAPTQTSLGEVGMDKRNPKLKMWILDEFCADCHDGNAGRHVVKAPLFSEDRALRGQGSDSDTPAWKGNYDLAYGHDANTRHCGRQMRFNPEDNLLAGPRCRNCHKGSSSCGTCHTVTADGSKVIPLNEDDAADNTKSYSMYSHIKTTTNEGGIDSAFPAGQFKKSRTVAWVSDWRTTSTSWMAEEAVDEFCSDDGFSWPHRTLGWKMLKDDLFGLNFDGTPVVVGDGVTTGTFREYAGSKYKVHDLDSVCLDCHNPTIWNATSGLDHIDDQTDPNDNRDDEVLTRGLP